jgi:SAM-dependent methyltransferase
MRRLFASLDLIVSSDVFEHVPHPEKALSECARVLVSKGATLLATIPFHSADDRSVQRARIDRDGVQHILPPVYHGNPVSEEGSLVFTDFGWDLLESFRCAGFSDAKWEVYVSIAYGHFGGGPLVLRATT